MFGQNPKRGLFKGDGSVLQVQEIFRTVQGEGLYTGWPAVFVRLGGCNLACEFCDTEFESFEETPLWLVLKKIEHLSLTEDLKLTHTLVVITGGEPMRQPIEELCYQLLRRGFKVQIETNGTLYRELDERVDIICSPKNTGNGYQKIRGDLLSNINALKFIISSSCEGYQDIGDVGQSEYDIPVYVQPMDEGDERKNRKNLDRVIQLSQDNGYRISLQTHKVMGID